jgi:UDP-N-acetylmuramoyl-L-alanyl-D-glutamate--2,6-diaminopimelate ligase
MSFLNILRKITPKFVFYFYHLSWAFLSALVYGFPSKKIKVIGITGTDGKTTTAEMIYTILTEAGYKTAIFSSIKIKVGEKEEKNMYKMTMPGRGATQKFLKRAVKEKCQYAIVEVTSEGIVQHRHRFIDFEAVVLTNLNKEHLERHGGFENYRNAKLELFRATKENHIINIDDKNAEFFLNIFSKRKWLYGIDGSNLLFDFNNIAKEVLVAQNIEFFEDSTTFFVKNKKIKLNLLGKFNVYNALAAIGAALSQGISLDICASALAKVKNVSGRMEIVSKKPLVFVDYAHTPNALTNVYETVNNFKKGDSKLICVLGAAGGGRDKWKRKELGRIADNYCDFAILTNEDPYDENPEDILNEIETGFLKISENGKPARKSQKYEKILDRKEAIKKAINFAKPDDIICITGKGREPLMCIANDKKIKWDDREIVEEFLKAL